MNFAEIYEELLDVLAENPSAVSDPQYWPEAQLKRFINRAQSQVVKSAGLNDFLLPLQAAELGAYYLPPDILKHKRIYYAGKSLDHKSVEFLDSNYGGTMHQTGKIGDGKYFNNNWRNAEGVPIHWYFENNKIKLYPKPETSLSLSTIRGKLTGSLSAGGTGITLAGSIPLDQNRVNFFYRGVYQNKDQWSITNSTTIAFAGWSAIVDGDYEIVYIPDDVSLSVIAASEKYLIDVTAGQTKVVIPGGYTPGVGALNVAINGVTQAASAYSEPSRGYINLTSAPVVASSVEVTVTRPDPTLTASILYCQKPVDMVNDSDLPAIENEEWQYALVHYAAWKALTKEGKMTQDLQKAQIHAQLYQDVINDILSITRPDIDVSARVAMPFFV